VTPRLLVLDDDRDIQTLLRSYFGHLGWSVESSGEAERGLDLVEAVPFDAVICDLHLGPGHQGEGLSVIERVRARRPTTAVVLFTAATSTGVRAAAMRAGADDVVPKPISLADLRDATIRAMKTR
jgi:DNA-binding response OmpR family regulator